MCAFSHAQHVLDFSHVSFSHKQTTDEMMRSRFKSARFPRARLSITNLNTSTEISASSRENVLCELNITAVYRSHILEDLAHVSMIRNSFFRGARFVLNIRFHLLCRRRWPCVHFLQMCFSFSWHIPERQKGRPSALARRPELASERYREMK